jgi:hypothetical protein
MTSNLSPPIEVLQRLTAGHIQPLPETSRLRATVH